MFTDLFRRKPLGEKARLEASERKNLNDVQCGGDLLRIIADGEQFAGVAPVRTATVVNRLRSTKRLKGWATLRRAHFAIAGGRRRGQPANPWRQRSEIRRALGTRTTSACSADDATDSVGWIKTVGEWIGKRPAHS